MRRPRNAAIDSGTIAATGDGSTAPSEGLDGSDMGQVGEDAEGYGRKQDLSRHRLF